jgi:hypothetical protein
MSIERSVVRVNLGSWRQLADPRTAFSPLLK